MGTDEKRLTYTGVAITLFATFVAIYFAFGEIRNNPWVVIVLVALLLLSVVITFLIGQTRLADRARRKLLRKIGNDHALNDLRGDCEVEGAELRHVSDKYPTVGLLNDNEHEDDIFKLICEASNVYPQETAKALKAHPTERSNEPNLVLNDRLDRLDGMATGWRTDYRAVAAITELRSLEGLTPARPNVLSANALVVDKSKQMVGLQLRSIDVETFPGHHHVLGGSYKPRGDANLAYTAKREIEEETEDTVNVQVSGSIALLQHENETNFTAITFLGVRADSSVPSRNNDEGHLEWYPLDTIPDKLTDKKMKWVPTGKQAVIAWLALGCPMGESGFACCRLKATKLFDEYQRLARRS